MHVNCEACVEVKVAFSDQFQVEQGTRYSAATACNLVTSSGVS